MMSLNILVEEQFGAVVDKHDRNMRREIYVK